MLRDELYGRLLASHPDSPQNAASPDHYRFPGFFPTVWALKPPESLLTSFSILFAGYKGDIQAFLDGANAIAHLTERSTVLIAEACAMPR